MKNAATPGAGRYEEKSWAVMLLVCVLAPAAWFAGLTGVGWQEMLSEGALAAGMGLFGAAITLSAFRRGERWAWFVLWYYPAFLTAHILASGSGIPGMPLLLLSMLGLLLPVRRFFGGRSKRRVA
ncbi:hypothetical protein RxyAA322_20490 [Rubrobacter xylanophilus]|uniref:Uncharacterized protein n=1 Tax=Rubrobacter xylanophilus TaxID=49319 RepID=A0A510HLH7_9ACTN|nr:DUF4175 domain-containing protein [Rubrobacter xylanophilus]BBL80195.1 hypothetical protein RxyAA322_20490 [Rubrobacter xylanophilus]